MPFLNSDDVKREIYAYSDGTNAVHADPSVIWRKINQACAARGETWEGLSKKWNDHSGNPENMTPEQRIAHNRALLDFQGLVVGIAYEAFGLSPITADGGGVNENFAMDVLCDFMEEREKKGPSTAATPSSSAPTAGPPPATSNPSSAIPSGMPTSTGSNSTRRSPMLPTVPLPSVRSRRPSAGRRTPS